MTINEIVALASVIVSIGTNVALYVHLSSSLTATINARFEIVDRHFESLGRRFDMLFGKVVEIDNRLTRVEERMGIRP